MSLTAALTKTVTRGLTRTLTSGISVGESLAGQVLADQMIIDLQGWSVPMTSTEEDAVRSFYDTCFPTTFWSKIKCLWFPIFGASGPSAIDFKTVGSVGTFVNSWGFGSSGATPTTGAYFNTGQSWTDWGLSTGTGAIVTCTATTTDYGMFGGVWDASNSRILMGTDTTPRLFYLNADNDSAADGTGGRVSVGSDKRAGGCFIGNRAAGGRQLFERKNSGFTVLEDWSSASVGSDPGYDFYFGGYNSGGGVADNNLSDYMCFGLTEGLTQSEAEVLSQAIYDFITDWGLGGALT